jgi:flagella basal body P-ring formation protein FlgA
VAVVAAVFCAATHVDAAPTISRSEARNPQSLQTALVAIAEEELQPFGLHVEPQRAWVKLSTDLPLADYFEVRGRWVGSNRAPSLPLVFELQPRLHGAVSVQGDPVTATLGVVLTRDVWIAARRLRKGSLVTCNDLARARRRMHDVSPESASTECEIRPHAVALRELAEGDVIRNTDVGAAPAVAAGSTVRVSVASGGINISTTAIALDDANVGDRIDVRLRRPNRTLRTRVNAPGQAEIVEGAQ